MKQLLPFIFVLGFCVPASAQSGQDTLLTRLNAVIAKTATYDSVKRSRIEGIKQALNGTAGEQTSVRFSLCEQLYEEYRYFNYDSAYQYSVKLKSLAEQLNNPDFVIRARIDQCFILLSAGLFKETYDSLQRIDIRGREVAFAGDYYLLWGRYYYDIAEYDNDIYHSVHYDRQGSAYLDSALHFLPPSGFGFSYYTGLRNLKTGDGALAMRYLQKLAADTTLTHHEVALAASTLSGIYMQHGDTAGAIRLIVKAIEADIESSTKENIAIFRLASLLYGTGDFKEAALCIETAIANAEFYGARQRKVQVSSVLQLIEGERINGIEAQRHLLVQYATIVTVLVFVLLLLAYIIYKQVKNLKKAQVKLAEANERQLQMNEQLSLSNEQLAGLNGKLEEVNKIKEEYIGHFFDIDAEFYDKIEKIRQTIEQKIKEKKYDDIRFFLNKIDAKKEKEVLIESFDKIFIKLFPNFVQEFNTLLRSEDAIVLKEQEILNTDLRIFALIRMGITDTDKIASFLGYSVKTIYTYKTRMKNKSDLPNELFEEHVMQIRSV